MAHIARMISNSRLCVYQLPAWQVNGWFDGEFSRILLGTLTMHTVHAWYEIIKQNRYH
jgi:hypothetical protein